MRRTVFAIALASSLVVSSSLASAAPKDVVLVVEVTGEGLDTDRVRSAVGRELSVTSVAPDDPRATSAMGRLAIVSRSRERTLEVTFTKNDLATKRHVALPADGARAESTAILLAGNVARDEASDLLDGMKKKSEPEQAAPPANEATEEEKREATELAQMTALLKKADRDANQSRVTLGVGLLIASAAFATPSIYFAASGGESTRAADSLATGLLSASLFSGIQGGALLIGYATGGPEHALVVEAERGSATPAATIPRVDEGWRRAASSARNWRHVGGIVALVGGTLVLSLTTVSILAAGPRQDEYPTTGFSMAAGVVLTLGGIHSLSSESPIETSYASYKTMKGGEPRPWWTNARRRPAPTLGVAPLPGGGLVSAGFSF